MPSDRLNGFLGRKLNGKNPPLSGVNADGDVLFQMAEFLGCKTEKLPFCFYDFLSVFMTSFRRLSKAKGFLATSD